MFDRCKELLVQVLAITSFASGVSASGWNDYEIAIDPSYKIYRNNDVDICLGKDNGELIYYPQAFAETGPITGFCVTPTHILLCTIGRSPRNLFPGDTLEEVDTSKEFFFVCDKSTARLEGPFSRTVFSAHRAVRSQGDVNWTEPKNPRFGGLIRDKAMFMIYSAILFAGSALPIVVLFIIYRTLRSRLRSPSQEINP